MLISKTDEKDPSQFFVVSVSTIIPCMLIDAL